MNTRDKSILIGLTIGDGYISAYEDKRWDYIQYQISFIHCEKQKEYIEYKADLIHSIFGGKKPSVIKFNNNGYIGYKMKKTNKNLKYIRNIMYKNNKKIITEECLNYLTPETIAIWYMDDGSLGKKKRNGKIHAYELFLCTYMSDEEHDLIINYFKTKWDVSFVKVKDKSGFRLRCGTKEARKFVKIIKDYVLPCMKYKIDIPMDI